MTDAERKLEEIREFVDSYPRGSAFQQSGMQTLLRSILDAPPTVKEYRSRREDEPNPEEIRTGGAPDPKKLARMMLDALTGGALTGLIGIVRDDRVNLSSPEDRELFNDALHMLGIDK